MVLHSVSWKLRRFVGQQSINWSSIFILSYIFKLCNLCFGKWNHTNDFFLSLFLSGPILSCSAKKDKLFTTIYLLVFIYYYLLMFSKVGLSKNFLHPLLVNYMEKWKNNFCLLLLLQNMVSLSIPYCSLAFLFTFTSHFWFLQ